MAAELSSRGTYVLKVGVINPCPIIEITQADYECLVKARSVLNHAFSIEEKYDILVTNYLDFENQLAQVLNRTVINPPNSYLDFFLQKHSINIKFINLLTAARLYFDQMKTHFKVCAYHLEDPKDYFDSLKSNEMSKNISFNFMEQFRNFVQHAGLPVHSMGFGVKSDSLKNGDAALRHYINIEALKDEFRRDRKFSQAVLDKLDDRINLLEHTRGYIEAISEIQFIVRNVIRHNIDESRMRIESAVETYKKVYSYSLDPLCAYKQQDDQLTEPVSLLLQWDEIRVLLEKKNPRLFHLKNKFVSTQLEQDS